MEGSIYVTVQIDDGSRIPGAIGTVASPALQGEPTQVSNVEGEMLFLDLPPGKCVLTVALEGFQTARRDNIAVTLGKSTMVEITLKLANIEES